MPVSQGPQRDPPWSALVSRPLGETQRVIQAASILKDVFRAYWL